MIQPQYLQQQPQLTPPTASGAGTNAVGINIYNPQAFAAPQAQAQQPRYDNQIYGYQQASAYAPYVQPGVITQGPYLPSYDSQIYGYQQASAYGPAPQTPYVQPYSSYMTSPQQVPYPNPPVVQTTQQQADMPPPVLENTKSEQSQQAQQTHQSQQSQQTQSAQPTQAIQEPPKAPPLTLINLDELVKELTSDNFDTQAAAITKVALHSQARNEDGTPNLKEAYQVVKEPIWSTLIGITERDTTVLPGPSDEQKAIKEKMAKGEPITPEEQQLFNQGSPQDHANLNKSYAMYTLAMLQKHDREQAIAANKPAPTLDKLTGYNSIINAMNNPASPDAIKEVGLFALSYVLIPELDAPALRGVAENMGNEINAKGADADPELVKAYNSFMEKIGPAIEALKQKEQGQVAQAA